MSWQATSATKRLVCDASGRPLTARQKLLLFVLADSIDPHSNLAHPSQKLLAQQTLSTIRTVQRLLMNLSRQGLVEILGPGRRGGHYYRLTYVPPEEERKGDKMSHYLRKDNATFRKSMATSGTDKATNRARKGDIAMSPEEYEEYEEKEKEKSSGSSEPSPLAFAGTNLKITQKQDQLLAEGFPWVDRPAEYRKMDSWLEGNPERRPQKHGRFAHNWFSKIPRPKELSNEVRKIDERLARYRNIGIKATDIAKQKSLD